MTSLRRGTQRSILIRFLYVILWLGPYNSTFTTGNNTNCTVVVWLLHNHHYWTCSRNSSFTKFKIQQPLAGFFCTRFRHLFPVLHPLSQWVFQVNFLFLVLRALFLHVTFLIITLCVVLFPGWLHGSRHYSRRDKLHVVSTARHSASIMRTLGA